MRLLVFGTYDATTHPRVATIADGLRARGVDVARCNAPLGLDTAARVDALAKPSRIPAFLATVLRRWCTLALAARRLPKPDVVLVGYLGHFDVHLARLLFRGVPIVLDHLIGASSTARDRRLDGGPRQALMGLIDSAALRAADVVVVDTDEHRDALPDRYRDDAVVVPVGAPQAWFDAAPQAWFDAAPDVDRTEQGPLRVVFYGLYTPLQGTPVIGAALGLLAGAPVEVTMIGGGQDAAEAKSAAAANTAVRWLDWVPSDELPALVGGHDVCLGIFGTGEKALRVVPNKVFQGAAAGCAVVTSDTAPQRRTLGDAARLVPPGDPTALADALRSLAADRAELAGLRKAARDLARQRFTAEQVVEPLAARLHIDPAHERQESPMVSGSTTARDGAPPNADALAPLTPNAWLRFDMISRMLPAGVTDVLEVGCGQGALGARLAQRYRYLGVEPDESSCGVARQRVAAMGSGEVRQVSVADLGDERFDLVCAFEVLEHIEDDAAALTEWATRLRPGGWLLLSVPAHQRRYGPADELVGHFRRYDPEVLAALLRRCGFAEVDLRLYGMPLGYVLEAGRNAIGRRKLARAAADLTVAERTAGSGRLLQPSGGLRGAATRWATAPFRLAQRGFPNTGPGLIARARLAD
jgi:SAM-dependent methyltransferase/glycosyltransferase involved in cell wall biosynthesis